MLIFLKLGGSLITDKAQPETAHYDTVARLAKEVKAASDACPDLALLIGHGSGSFGHTTAKRYGTHQGVKGKQAWHGFAQVATVAARLNHIVLETLSNAGLPVLRIQPSASAICDQGQLVEMATQPIEQALGAGLVPLLYGDVAIDKSRGGTIISTEAIFSYLAHQLKPERILLAGDFDGVLDEHGTIIPHVTPPTLSELSLALSGSEQIDVTGGMAAKVLSMLELCQTIAGLEVYIFSGQEPGHVQKALTQPHIPFGTRLSASS